jgi:AraC-like DNA-binding protein
LEKKIIDEIKRSGSFEERVEILVAYFNKLVNEFDGSSRQVKIVSEILDFCNNNNNFSTPIETLARKYNISSRTLQRYFEITTSLSTKKTLQILRVRKAVSQIAKDPSAFDLKSYGYYDYSHFYKHLKQFLQKSTLVKLKPHLNLLGKLHKEKE